MRLIFDRSSDCYVRAYKTQCYMCKGNGTDCHRCHNHGWYWESQDGLILPAYAKDDTRTFCPAFRALEEFHKNNAAKLRINQC